MARKLKKESPGEAILKGEGMKKFKHLSNDSVSFDGYILPNYYEYAMLFLLIVCEQ